MPSLGEETRELADRVISWDTAIICVCCAIPATLEFTWWGSCVSAALVSAYYFAIVRHVGSSRDGLPGPEDADDLTTAGKLGGAVALAAAVPFIVHGISTGFAPPRETLGTFLAIALVPQLYLPAAVIAVATSGSWQHAFWPPSWLGVVGIAPREYWRLVLQFLLIGVGGAGLDVLSGTAAGKIPVLGVLVLGSAGNLLLVLQACLAGGFVSRNLSIGQ